MSQLQFAGIRYPERAERIEQFSGYRVFLEHWLPLARQLTEMYEGLYVRRETRCLGIFGEQGAGKTLFSKKLVSDFQITMDNQVTSYDPSNLWHQMTAWRDQSPQVAFQSTQGTKVIQIQDDKEWQKTVKVWLEERQTHKAIVIVDEADQAYFRQALVQMSDMEFAKEGDSDAAFRLASQRFVKLCRTELSGCLFILLSNSRDFLERWKSAVDQQHRNLFRVVDLPFPGAKDKETVVRINTNRLNPFSYWFCLDKAGPDQKLDVLRKLSGANTFPDSFAAVDNAIRLADRSRIGRPARKGVISLIVISNTSSFASFAANQLGDIQREELNYKWMRSIVYTGNWTAGLSDRREQTLLESEWDLRLILLGNEFVSSLLDTDKSQCINLLNGLKDFLGPGTHDATRSAASGALQSLIDAWIPSATDTVGFWAGGQFRSVQYENALRDVLPGYNSTSNGFLGFRPDAVVEDFVPCSIVSASSEAAADINRAIKREAHVFEFTAISNLTTIAVKNYLGIKLPNYVAVVQEQ